MLVLLDRDGVINEDTPTGIIKADDLRLIDGSAEAIAELNAAGIKVALITNQSVVGKGLVSAQELDDIHGYLQGLLAEHNAQLDAIYACHDHPDAPTDRRKPAAGMLLEALRDFDAAPEQTPMVGDALRDLQAAQSAGCPAHLVLTGKGQKLQQSSDLKALKAVEIHTNLRAFVTKWLHHGEKPA